MNFSNISNNSYFSFLLLPRKNRGVQQKKKQKRAPKSPPDRTGRDNTPPDSYRDREGALIKLLHYCKLEFSSLIFAAHCLLPIFNSTTR